MTILMAIVLLCALLTLPLMPYARPNKSAWNHECQGIPETGVSSYLGLNRKTAGYHGCHCRDPESLAMHWHRIYVSFNSPELIDGEQLTSHDDRSRCGYSYRFPVSGQKDQYRLFR
uniref:Uncharacterized protein n=1 Tax=Candidatus Kentrum sp. FW TaxID=2126338 RepID=A0A450RZA7_9GAMM|nr:MAG: hypothetical protein BECKFW1821A_GA0114235_100732 [Candidatus Kentron sp. FW]VFJ54167.1 MAG: hypothetical protein BECKFW1821B_GA0114236_101723 [Candidatus Kentron sp. FW]